MPGKLYKLITGAEILRKKQKKNPFKLKAKIEQVTLNIDFKRKGE